MFCSCLTTLALARFAALHDSLERWVGLMKPRRLGVQRKSDGSHKVLRVLDKARHSVPFKMEVPGLDTR